MILCRNGSASRREQIGSSEYAFRCGTFHRADRIDSVDLSQLSDEALLGKVEALAETERFSLIDLIIHLGELDGRTACQRRGYASMFAYLTRGLGYAECDAMRRVRTSRAARQYPSILRMLASRELNLVSVSMLQPLLTPENHERLLRRAARRSTREVERMVAELAPATAEPRDRIRPLPPAAPAAPAPQPMTPNPLPDGHQAAGKEDAVARSLPPSIRAGNGVASAPPQDAPRTLGMPGLEFPPPPGCPPAESAGSPTPSHGPALPAAPIATTSQTDDELTRPAAPAAAEDPAQARVVFTFTAGEEVQSWFEAARDLLRHRFPSGRMEEVIGEALRRLVQDELPSEPKRRRTETSPGSRHIPKRVQDEVWRRDSGRCAFVGPEGVRCAETAWLEFDHIVPFALGGPSNDPANIRLLCRAHNQSEARRLFGDPRLPGRQPEKPC